MLERMPFTRWIATTWRNLGTGGRVLFAIATFFFIGPVYIVWLPVDLIVGLVRLARPNEQQEPRGMPQDAAVEPVSIPLESQTLETWNITSEEGPVNRVNWPLAVELVRRVNLELENRPIPKVPDYRHPAPISGRYVDWPPQGTAVWKTAKGYKMRVDGIVPRSREAFDRTELFAFFRADGSLYWVESVLRVYRPRLKVSDPYHRKWIYERPNLKLVRATYPTREGAWLIEHEINV